MRIGAMLGVMDEAALLPRCVDHLYGIGVDHIVALDSGSRDGSLEWLQARQGDRLTVISVPATAAADPETAADFETRCVRSSDCDWMICLAVDEFWLPATASLRDCRQCLDPTVDVITVQRFNVVPDGRQDPLPAVLGPSEYPALWLFARRIPGFRELMAQQPQTAWIDNA
jgi:hypothetical protein